MAMDGDGLRARVTVLLATHDGAEYLQEQLDSILRQRDVEVRVVVSDDASRDATPALLAAAAADPRVELLPSGVFGSPQANFLRLMRDADVTGADAVAFADQDDVWHDDKLARQFALLRGKRLDAVSSNVVAFWPRADGGVRRRLIDKAQPQRSLDFLFESAGPGCTFVLEASAFRQVRDVLAEHPLVDPSVAHDWLVYAVARALGLRWRIDPTPTIDYRQHGSNATGANSGPKQALVRLRALASGRFRSQVGAVARLTAAIAAPALGHRLATVLPLLESNTPASRAALRRLVPELRRAHCEQRLLAVALRVGLW